MANSTDIIYVHHRQFDNGTFAAVCPALDGLSAHGPTYEAARDLIESRVRTFLQRDDVTFDHYREAAAQ
jgi:predicted RNase H-like HicB family nuclease